jgi:hypothetical protein
MSVHGIMPRTRRSAPGGMVYHVFNRGVGRQRRFRQSPDYAAFDWCDETVSSPESFPTVLVLRPARATL